MLITKIERQKKHPSRCSIFIYGEFAFGISDKLLLLFSLHQGASLEQGEVDKILKAELEETAKQKAFRFLSIRPRSRKEIRDYLLRKEYSEEVAETVILKLESLKLLDDVAFARMLCRDSMIRKPMGEKLARQVMFKKGVPRPVIDSVIPEFFSSESELILALKAAEKHQQRARRSSKMPDELHVKKKLLDFLMRRGFAYETAMSAAKQTLTK